MHGISFGSSNLPYGLGPVQGFSGHHGVARSRNDERDSGSSVGPSLGGVLSNLSNSIADLRSQLESLSSSRDLPVDGAGLSASAMGATIINKQRGELQIHTLEGDVVTLKFNSKVGVSIEGQQISDGSTTLTNTSLEMHSREKLRISVEGDLNEAELAAINDLVEKVGELTSDFFNGDLEGALAQAMSLSYDSSVVADYSLDLSLKQSVRAYTYAAAWAPPKQVETAPEDEPITEVIDATPPNPVSEAVATTPEAPVPGGETTPLAEPTTDATPVSDTGSATQIVADFVAKVRSSLRMTTTDSSLGMTYELKVKLLISSISESAPTASKPANAALDYLQQQLGSDAAA